jgi:hypothetical protein
MMSSKSWLALVVLDVHDIHDVHDVYDADAHQTHGIGQQGASRALFARPARSA